MLGFSPSDKRGMKWLAGSHRRHMFFGCPAAASDQADVVGSKSFGTTAVRSAGLIASSGRMPTPGFTSKGTSTFLRGSSAKAIAAPCAGLTVEPEDGRSGGHQPPAPDSGQVRPFPETDEDGDRARSPHAITSSSTGSISGNRNVSSSKASTPSLTRIAACSAAAPVLDFAWSVPSSPARNGPARRRCGPAGPPGD